QEKRSNKKFGPWWNDCFEIETEVQNGRKSFVAERTGICGKAGSGICGVGPTSGRAAKRIWRENSGIKASSGTSYSGAKAGIRCKAARIGASGACPREQSSGFGGKVKG